MTETKKNKVWSIKIKGFNICQPIQFNRDFQIDWIEKPANPQSVELSAKIQSIQFNIEIPLIDLQPWQGIESWFEMPVERNVQGA